MAVGPPRQTQPADSAESARAYANGEHGHHERTAPWRQHISRNATARNAAAAPGRLRLDRQPLIERHIAFVDEATYEAAFVEMEWLFKKNGLPSPYATSDDEYLWFMQDVAELLERMHDAVEAGDYPELHRATARSAHCRAKERW